jgi:hypothetical protein
VEVGGAMKVIKEVIIISLLSIAIICGLCFCAQTTQQTQTVVSEGVAIILNEDIAKARDEALKDARKKAVEEGIGVYIQAETLIKNLQLVEDRILSRAQGYIKNEKILLERQEGKLYRIKIQADVVLKEVEKDLQALGILQRRMKKPRVMIIVTAKARKDQGPLKSAETTMIKEFLSKEFKVVDQAQVEKIRSTDYLKQILKGNKKTAKLIASKTGADILVITQGSIGRPMKVEGGLISCRCFLDARVINADTGEIIVAETASGSGIDIAGKIASQKAQEKTAKTLAAKLTNRIIYVWGKFTSGLRPVQLQVENIKDYELLSKFENFLKRRIRCVDGLYRRSFFKGIAFFDLDISGDIDSLVYELTGKDFKNFKVKVLNISSNRLDIKLVEKELPPPPPPEVR